MLSSANATAATFNCVPLTASTLGLWQVGGRPPSGRRYRLGRTSIRKMRPCVTSRGGTSAVGM
jgi:hypothetical protein